MRFLNRKGAIVAAAVAALGISTAARANLIAYDGFAGDTTGATSALSGQPNPNSTSFGWATNYLLPNDGSTATGHTAVDGTVTNAGLISPETGSAYGLSSTLSGSSVLNPNNGILSNAVDFRVLSNPITTQAGNTLFISMLVSRNDTNPRAGLISLYTNTTAAPIIGNVNANDAVDIGEAVQGTNGTNLTNWGFETTNGAAAGTGTTFNTLGGANGSKPVAWTGVPNQSAANKSTVLLVTELDYKGGDDVEMYVNPTGSTPGSAANMVQVTGLTLPSIDAVRIFAGGNSTGLTTGTNQTSMNFDEISVGTQFADVVPEPATLGLLAPALVLLASRRQARRKSDSSSK